MRLKITVTHAMVVHVLNSLKEAFEVAACDFLYYYESAKDCVPYLSSALTCR